MLVQHKFLLSNAAKSTFQTSCTRNSSSDNVNSAEGQVTGLACSRSAVLQVCVWYLECSVSVNNTSKREEKKKKEKKSTGASGLPAQPKLCNASLNMSLVQTQASLMFFNRNIWWNPMIGSSSACRKRGNRKSSKSSFLRNELQNSQ